MQATIIVGILTLVLLLTIGRVAVSAETFVPPVQPQRASSAQKKIAVNLKNAVTSSAVISVSSSLSSSSFIGGISQTNTIVYRVAGDINQALSQARANPNVEAAYIPSTIYAFDMTNDPDLTQSKQWSLLNMKVADPDTSVETAWDKVGNSHNAINRATSVIKIAVLDTGVNTGHPDLASKVIAKANCLSGSCVDGQGEDDHGHGSHVSGIIGAVTDNSTGIAGVGWGVKILSGKVLDHNGTGDTTILRNGIAWAIDHHVNVINMSLGVNEGNIDAAEKNDLRDAVNRAWNAGIVVVAAAGNCGETDSCPVFSGTSPTPIRYETNPDMYPAKFGNVLSVAALTNTNQLAPYSEHNGGSVDWVDVAAPGGYCCTGYAPGSCPDQEVAKCVKSTYLTTSKGSYAYMRGTSQASPHIAGVAALILAKNPSLSNTQVRAIIENAGNTSWGGGASTHGGVNALTAMQNVPAETQPTATVTPTVPPNATATPTVPPNATNTPAPLPTLTPYPTTGVPELLKVPPSPYPQGPYCPIIPVNCNKRNIGDADCDNSVNDADYAVWKTNYDTFANRTAQVNANFSCVEGNASTYWVDLSDFEIWRRNKIMPTGPNPTATRTPTPTTVANPTATPTLGPSSTPTPSVSPGLISYWKMDDESGPDVSDEETVNNGTAIGTSIVGGKVGTARKFDGVDDKIVVGSNDSIDNLATLSICAWIYPASYGENEKGRIYAKGAKMWFSLEDDNISADKTFRFGVNYSGTDLRVSGANNLISLNEWQYACVTWDGSANPAGVKFYKNGIEAPPHRERSTGGGSRVDDSGANGIIGNSPGGNATFKGRIDEMRLYRKVLSAGEVQSLFAGYQ